MAVSHSRTIVLMRPANDGPRVLRWSDSPALLHHASARPLYGLAMIEELARHGYRLSPGTLYPILRRLEKKGYLRSAERRLGRMARRMYRITPSGRGAYSSVGV